MKKKEERGRKICTHLKKERKTRKTIERNRFGYPNLKIKKMEEIASKKEEYKGR